MLKSLTKRLWALRHQFIRYFIVGVGAVVLDVSSLYVLKEYFHLSSTMAVVINQVGLFFFVFFMNKYWSFGAKGGQTHRQMIRFLVMAGSNYVISVGWMWFFTEYWPVHLIGGRYDYLLVRVANIALSVCWNFVLYKNWVYKKDADPMIETLETLE